MSSKIARPARGVHAREVSRLLCGASLAAVVLTLPSVAHAQDQDLHWDANGAQPGSGGSGNWNTTDRVWSEANSDVLGPYDTWANDPSNPDNAIFGVSAPGVPTTPGTITLTTPITVHDLTFQSVHGWVLDGGTLTLAGAAPTLTVTGDTTINSTIAGTAGLTKAGGRTLTLSGTNTFSGGITFAGGTLVAATDAALGAASNNIDVTASGALSILAGNTARTVNTASGTTLTVGGAGVGSALFTGAGNLSVGNGVALTNDSSSYAGTTRFSGCNGVCSASFSSIADLGVVSSLGAPTTAANGTITWQQTSQYSDYLIYTGDGDSSNRNWTFNVGSTGIFANQGTGTLTLTGTMTTSGTIQFLAQDADFAPVGIIEDGTGVGNVSLVGSAAGSVTLGNANTYSGRTNISGGIANVSVLANGGNVSSLGTGTLINLASNGVLNYTGTGANSDRTFTSSGAVGISNSGSGALTLSGPLSFVAGGVADTLTFGGNGAYGGTNTFSGAISGAGNLASTGSSIWELTADNATRSGTVAVSGGTLRAGSASAFGTITDVTINGGTLDLGGFDLVVPRISGTGGSVALSGGADLTVSGLTPTNDSTYAGSLTGDGGLIKRGTSALTLTGQSDYTGATTIQGGTLTLDFTAASAPASNIVGSGSQLVMAGGTLSIKGADGEANSQAFDGLNVTAGTNRIAVTSGTGGTMNLSLGVLTSTGGLLDFALPANGTITTANANGPLGWATINGRDYAQVTGGVLGAFTGYTDTDEAADWLDNQVISDDDNDALTFSGTVTGSKQLGGLQYTVAQNSLVSIGAGNTLGVNGAIIVANSAGATSKQIDGGSLTGPASGGTLGFLHNGTGTFLVSSQVTDNGGNAVGVTKAGTGTLTFNNNNNSYTGATVLSGGILQVTSIGDGGVNSAMGASSAASSNLVLESGRFSYNGATATTDRGFTLVNGGPRREIEVFGTTDLTFTGLVTSPDDAGLVKIGAGTLTLANDANDYIGVTRIENGVLSVDKLADGGQASGIGAASNDAANLVLLNGGTLQYTGGTAGMDRGVTLENAAGRIDVGNAATTLTVGGPIVGAGRLEKYGDGTLVLTGANTYSGVTVVNAGTLRAGASLAADSTTGVFGAISSAMTVNTGATLDLADNSNQIGALNGGGNVTLGASSGTTLTIGGANSGDPGFTGTISGAGNVTHTNGTQVMTGCGNSYTGVTTVTGEFGGSVLNTDCIQDGGADSGIGASGSDSANLVLQNNGVLNYTAIGSNQVTDRGFTLAAGFGYIQVADAGTSLEFTGVAAGSGHLVKRGVGTLILSGDNTYTGQTRVEAGRLVAGAAGAFDQGTNGLLMSDVTGAVFDLNGYDARFLYLAGGGAAGGDIDLGSATLTVTNGSNQTYAGTISGTGSLIVAGAGAAQVLTGCDSSYSGTTTLSGGILQVSCLTDGGQASSIGSSGLDASNLVLGGGRFIYIGAGDNTDRLFTLGASTRLEASGTGALAFTNTGPIVFATPDTNQTITLGGTNTGNNSLAPLIANNGTGITSLTKADAGTWMLTNSDNTYTGATSIVGGVLGVDTLADGGEASSIGQSTNIASNLVIGSGGTLRYTGDGDTTDRLFTLGVGTTAIESSGTGAVVFNNTGAVSYTGNGARVVSLGGTYAGSNIMGAAIANQGANVTSLAKNDSGTWILTGNNTFSGSTVINDGNLVIGNGGTTGNAGTGNVIVDQATSTLSFNRADTFNFTGTISGPGAIAQIGSGTTVLTATNSIGAARADDGTLQVNGALQTATFAMNGDGALVVNGTVEGAVAGTTSTFGGDAGASAITVNAGGTLRATGDLGDGADSLSLAGLIGTGGGSFGLGAGDDILTLRDGGAITGTVDAGTGIDTLVVDNALARTLDAAQAAGFEALDKQNAGVLSLTGDHAYSAGTRIEAGTLSIGTGGTTGTLAGDVVDNGVLQFNRFDDLTFAGDISGTGSVVKLGSGSVATLTGDATHTGGTTISAGTLQIGDGGTTGSIAGDILNNASLRFDRSDIYTYDGVITGSGNVTQAGSGGTLNLTADSHWTGTALVNNDSELRVASGNTVTADNQTNITQGGTLTVTGADSTWVTGFGAVTSGNGSSTLNVENGGTYRTTAGGLALRAAGGTPGSSNVNISGAGSLVDLAGGLTVASTSAPSLGNVTISDGGTLRSGLLNVIGALAGNTTASTFTITGPGSNWTSTGTLLQRNGELSVLDGGAAIFDSAQIGTVAQGASALVSGAGSTFSTVQDLSVGSTAGNGVLTIADGGRVTVGGNFTLAADAGTRGVLAIGAAEGSPAAAAGVLDAPTLTFGPGAGTLEFNHTETNYIFATGVSGAGAIHQIAGNTNLTGNSAAFTGTTSITGGTLRVNGTLGDATSVVEVLIGGTLGGSGTIGGNVNVADGRIAPGNSPGTLTIAGNLALGTASQLDFEFGKANAPGDPLNDVIDVGGNLTLDGTLNVAVSPGGSFDIGLYRVINYGGTLADNGLDIGGVPPGVDASNLSVQTSVANQVNLINTGGATLNFWDGAAGPKFNGAVNGGDGVWQNSTGNDNWANSNGQVNAAFSDNAVAIFSAGGGTVTVDTGLGAVRAGGMQFASGGYTITGDAVTLVDPLSVIRVGDGSAAGAGYIATIESVLDGAGVQLVKTDLGTLVLSGVNTYTGGTLIEEGTLEISSNANLGDAAGGLSFNGGTLHTTADLGMLRNVDLAGTGTVDTGNAFVTFDGIVSGGGALIKQGGGVLALNAANSYTGGTTINAGILQVGSGTSGSILGNVVNNAQLTFARSDSVTFGGTISGAGSVSQLGAGVLTLTADNSYAGITSISDVNAGALQLGDGGTTGSIVGDVENGGTLIFNRSNEYSFAGAISGAGDIRQEGTGTTILTAANSYTGSTIISSGTLLINGDQTTANGMTNVLGGGAMGGIGTIGGDVFVGGGATLTPGDASGPGTLTINGNLGFSPNAVLAYEFGQSNVVGGSLNDLTEVAGNLDLDGTIDVTVSSGGIFDTGLYRVISYDGLLNDQGLAPGAMPAGSAVSVQTSIAHQVNLINSAGATVNFWDGGDPVNNVDGAVNGGDGVWQASTGNDNWADITGLFNNSYPDGSFAIFAAAPGTVTVDDDLGAVTASGLQFAVDGYTITGDTLALVGPTSAIRVGDGTADGMNYAATIASDLTVEGSFDKTDLGTLVLTGEGTISDSITIASGTLEVANGGVINTTGSATSLIQVDANLAVADAGSVFTSAYDLVVGRGTGSGSISVANGGQLAVGRSFIGEDSSAPASSVINVAVDGAGSLFANAGDLTVGRGAGTTSISVTNGGQLTAGRSYLGEGSVLSAASAIDISVDGLDSVFDSGSSLYLGAAAGGTATLTVSNGGLVTVAADAVIGNGGDGTALVTGAGSSLLADSVLYVGVSVNNGAGHGDLTIQDGGLVATSFLAMGYNDPVTSGSTGVLTLAGTAGSRGVLETGALSRGFGNAAITFDGGVLRATADNADFIENLGADPLSITLGANGGFVDTNSHDIAIAPSFVGAGGLTKDGLGTLVLSGVNAYTGATQVNAGTLFINGDQSAASGLTNVASGATLGGTGTIGGDVTLADGAVLAAGVGGVGTLTINGGLSLSAGSVLEYEFGQANVAGGALNDLVDVGGNLVLDGTLDVTVPTGGTFGPGIYRVFNYGGTLTDEGLTLGLMPDGSAVSVQTAIAGQVNLVNTADLSLSFWDGDAGPKNNGQVDGGNGVWRVGGSGDNWTNDSGTVNDGYAQDSFAIFSAAPGTVTIDNGGGDVRASGLQFASDGYIIDGGPLTLTGAQAIVQVGDSSAAGAGYTATIAAEITGAAQLVKTDLGTLVLTGTNSYGGGTAINGGTLQISADANLGDAASGLSLNGGTLETTADMVSGRAVALAGADTVLTGAGTTLTLSGAIGGAGSLTKSGAGTLVLAGNGSYAGTTHVGAGTLLVNGNHAGATGATSVASGASLGGTGTIGGDVTLADGAILTPGVGGAGTLTVGGNLSLSAGTTLAYELGQADTAGGALNDLVEVGGNLVLDGTLDVTVPSGGAFDAGVYRLFNYGGTLTDAGLTLGLTPGGSRVVVQTSIAGQVNLVNSAGLALNFWDGAAGSKFNDAVEGGDGVWQNGSGNDNWTDADGTVNAAYSDNAFAVFGGIGGTVTVDDSLGAVTAAGMQFAADGYTIAGDGVTLGDGQAIVRVGDGSAAGAGFTATIDAVLSGDARLIKTDAGTLVLGGANGYTGGTLISEGTVQVSDDGNLGAAGGGVTLDGGTLATSADMRSGRDIAMAGDGTIATAAGTTFTFDGLLSGPGVLTKAGAGTLLLTSDSSSFTGGTRVEGTLLVNGSLCGDVDVLAGGRLGGTGTVCTTNNAGTVAPGDSIGTLTVAGTYTGAGGVLEIEAELGGDGSAADRLVVTQGTAGTTEVVVVNRGGLGAQTVEGIKIVDVTGGASAGTFTLDGDYDFEGSPAVIAGAYGYRLFQGGVSTPADGDWYLRSALLDAPEEPQVPLYQPGVPLYESYAQTLQALNGLPTLQERVGNRRWSGLTQGGVGMWGRIEGSRQHPEAVVSTSGADVDADTWGLQAGLDATLADADAGVLIAGINGRYGNADARVQSRFGNGEIKTDGFGVGATLTWYGSGGLYADAQAQLSWFDSDLASSVLGSLANSNKGSGEAFSLEVGQRLPLAADLSLTPQGQLVYSNVRFDAFADAHDAAVSAQDGESLRGRLGVSLDHEYSWAQRGDGTARNHVYGIVNLQYEMLDGTRVDVSGTSLDRREHRLWGELGAGISHSWKDGQFTIFSEISLDTALADFANSNALRGNAGFRMKF